MRIICITNEKGGVGKTTTALNMVEYFDQLGQHALLVDLDPQGSATSLCLGGQPAKDEGQGLLEALRGTKPLRRCTRRIRYMRKAEVTPSGKQLALADGLLRHDVAGGQLALRNALLGGLWDTVVIDCPPSNKWLIGMALAAANYVVVPTTLEPLAVRGVADLTETIDTTTSLNPSLRLAGVLPTRVQANRSLAHRTAEGLSAQLGPGVVLEDYVREDVAVQQSDERNRPVLRRKSSRAADDYRGALAQLTARMDLAEAG